MYKETTGVFLKRDKRSSTYIIHLLFRAVANIRRCNLALFFYGWGVVRLGAKASLSGIPFKHLVMTQTEYLMRVTCAVFF